MFMLSFVVLFPPIAVVWPVPQSPHLECGFLITFSHLGVRKRKVYTYIRLSQPLVGRLQVLNATP